MHLKDINIVSSFNIVGRGKALATDLNYDLNHHRFKKGDTLRHDDKIYEINSVEAILSIGHNEHVAFLVKEITIGTLFDKHNKRQPVVKNFKWYDCIKLFFNKILK